ncbi:MAG: hypothetical protein GDA51_09250 [Ekhidna sp.]|nr:hypothetical protein [Ekhidna sp.]
MKVSLISFIHNGSFSSSKHVCVHQRKLRESGEPFARCSVLQKTKVNPEGMQLS